MAEESGSKKNSLKVHEPENNGGSTDTGGSGTTPRRKSRAARTSRWALAIALIALILVIGEKFSTDKNAIKSINQAITQTVVPQLNKVGTRNSVNTLYDLKRVMVTLEEIKETSTNEEVRTLVDQIILDMQDLSIKLIVHE